MENNQEIVQEGDSIAICSKKNKNDEIVFYSVKKGARYRIKGKKYLDIFETIKGLKYGIWYRYENEGKKMIELTGDPFKERYSCKEGEETEEETEKISEENDEEMEEKNEKKEKKEKKETEKKQETERERFERENLNISEKKFSTELSKEKYIRRKQMKKGAYLIVRKPNSRLICDSVLKKASLGKGLMRAESLSLSLTLGNVCAGCTCLIFDTVHGIALSGVFERMWTEKIIENNMKFGKIVRVHPEGLNSHMNYLNYLPSYQKYLSIMRNNKNWKLRDSNLSDFVVHLPLNYFSNETTKKEEKKEEKENKMELIEKKEEKEEKEKKEKVGEKEKEDEKEKIKKIKESLKDKFDSLIIATDEFDPLEIFNCLFPFLNLSGSFAVYSKSREPLEPLFIYLKESYCCANMNLQEVFSREMQILEKRTHPNMTGYHESGHVLSGVKIEI